MKKSWNSYPFYFLIIIFIVLLSCQKDQSIEYLSFDDFVCGPSKLAKELANKDYLYDWDFENGTLMLDFRFSNTCNSAYEESVSIENNTIHIALKDTAKSHARCVCEHKCLFQFKVEGMDNVRLLLDIKFYTSEEYVSCVDALLQL